MIMNGRKKGVPGKGVLQLRMSQEEEEQFVLKAA